MRNRFDAQLLELNNNLVRMGSLCESIIAMSMEAFLNGDSDCIEQARSIEHEINIMEKQIEQQCLRLLLQQQPVATDLRIISAALKMVTDLERIGDQSVDIAELTYYTRAISIHPPVKQMAVEAAKMVTNSINSFVKRDLALANSVILYDDVVDELFAQAKDIIVKDIRSESGSVEATLDLLMISKYLERIADHATNIAEWVVFSITGSHKEA